MTVEINVKVNTTEAEAKLRALEARAREVTALLGRTPGVPSATTPSSFPAPTVLASEALFEQNQALALNRQFSARPVDYTAALLGGAAAGSFVTGGRPHIPGPDYAAKVKLKYEFDKGRMGLFNRIEYDSYTLPDGTQRFAQIQNVGPISQGGEYGTMLGANKDAFDPKINSAVGRAVAANAAAEQAARQAAKQAASSKFFSTNVSPGLARIAPQVGFVSALTIATRFATNLSEERSAALQRAGETGDASQYSYGHIVGSALVDALREPPLFLAEKAGAVAASGIEALYQLGRTIGYGLDGKLAPPSEESVAMGRWASGAAQTIRDYWTNAERERYKSLAAAHSKWVDAKIKAIEKALDARAETLAHQALMLGFNWKTGEAIEDQIRQEIRSKYGDRIAREFDKANPEPKLKDFEGRRD